MELSNLLNNLPIESCLLCGDKPSIIGVFTPKDPESWGATIGKTRFFRYCLCEKCHVMPDAPDRAEKIIRAELAGGGVTHAE